MKHDATYRVDIGHLEQLEEAYKSFIEQKPVSGLYYAQDKVIELSLLAGDTLVTPVSSISYYTVSTDDGRIKHIQLNKEYREQYKSYDPEG